MQPLLHWKGNNYNKFSDCVCVCGLWYPTWNTRAPLSSVACCAQQYLSTLSVQILPETFLILSKTKHDMIRNVYRSSRKVPVILVRF